MKKMSVIIPAYNPDNTLLELVKNLQQSELDKIIVVNDGSKSACDVIFEQLKRGDNNIILLEHATNIGKGAALKTGLNYLYTLHRDNIGVITADADGQHLPSDILRIAEELVAYPNDLIIGRREFDDNAKKIPFRSRFGNLMTRKIFQFIVGKKVSDTQSGLRGIPMTFIPTLVTISNNGYEFELNMLMACKFTNRNIREVPIHTIYIDNNKNSHFNPILDSLKIYFVLFRFALVSLLSFIVDFSVFFALLHSGFSLLFCQIGGRICSIGVNYPMVKNKVFHQKGHTHHAFLKYLLLVAANCTVSYSLVYMFSRHTSASISIIKILVESVIFIANFTIERDFIFSNKNENENKWEKWK
ncbi:MAG: bifunctional glycosyltransferase family 2/GtrA family protein [Legionellales bacterium]|nr:bifunctional glycosyltransferase family 2/GtrA family protein [Legionellales bacterium]